MTKQRIIDCDWLYSEWHPKKNVGLDPAKITVESEQVVWWHLEYTDPKTGITHNFEWKAEIKKRFSKHSGCPYLEGRAVWRGYNDLATLHPDLALEWDAERNGMDATEVLGVSGSKKYWWIQHYFDEFTGKEIDFKWQASIYKRVKGTGNPYLVGRLLWPGYNDLKTRYPEIAAEWHPTKNGILTPEQVFAQDSRRVWWYKKYWDPVLNKEFEFEWTTIVSTRTRYQSSCPYISNRKLWPGYNDLATRHPQLAREWDFEKNGDLTPEQIITGARKKVWWIITYIDPETGKENKLSWKASVESRTKGSGCPYLYRTVLPGFNDLATRYPKLAQEWDHEKNGTLTPDRVMPGSRKEVWWVVKDIDPETGKENKLSWKASVARRTRGNGCPYISNKKVLPGYNDLVTTHPHLAMQWHPTKNGTLTPEQVTYGSQRAVWWYLPYIDTATGKKYEFEWKTTINARTNRDTGCPYLSNAAIYPGFNDLEARYPEIAAEWHPTKNGTLRPDQVFPWDNRCVWWYLVYTDSKTGITHKFEWKCAIRHRVATGSGCPFLTSEAVWTGFNDLASTHPETALLWHPEKNGTLTPEMVTYGSHKLAWWHMSYCDPITKKHYEFEWMRAIQAQTAAKCPCPYISGDMVWPGYNDLYSRFAEISDQWSEKNYKKPEQVYCYSSEKAWWHCTKCGSDWRTMINSRTLKGTECPKCGGI